MTENKQKSIVLDDLEIEKTAHLVALELEPGDRRRIREGLEVILDHFAVIRKATALEEAVGTPVERTVSIEDLRDDQAIRSDPKALLQAAPDFDEGWFFVPRVVE